MNTSVQSKFYTVGWNLKGQGFKYTYKKSFYFRRTMLMFLNHLVLDRNLYAKYIGRTLKFYTDEPVNTLGAL